ncbi:hypothetical protein M407DRAFT_24083 [Tulasnella calospora MUT 4182]|uniref:BTB domain-containing protein n=1 Tax=Tulasnella calospora MUT 4182 TaxID=1051891 RepID=A0A0C3KZ27_9AGAM|nr:hypothetical protein M407DRAFT_24083 [Tulasnella calospora MUT 4182]
MDIEELIFPGGAFVTPPPFDDASPGDSYLQSREGATFKVLRHILINSSQYFERLYKDLSPTGPGDLPKLLIEEDAQTLHALLILLYPVHADATKIDTKHT